MEQNKWEVKSHSHQIADTGDYDGYWEITNGKIHICTKDDGPDMPDILQEVADLLTKTECDFWVNNLKEIDLHFECEGLKLQLTEAQARCDRYEQALKDIELVGHGGTPFSIAECKRIASKALAWDGEKQVEKAIEYMPILSAELNEREYKGVADVPVRVPMHLLNENQAQSNHDQSLARLKERGGISIREALCLINGYHWSYYKGMDAKKAVCMLNELINQKEDKQ